MGAAHDDLEAAVGDAAGGRGAAVATRVRVPRRRRVSLTLRKMADRPAGALLAAAERDVAALE